ncbi:histone deacetylase 5-like isoform X2 [Prosopis cineraria]|uniref:histone deacetylase 5-like isoform X2 n=1 Tax=Prosopis cineraria TaxID=364024 RepID=UPI00240F7D44|nr:histone deacetylase 5-like isoform X2 [Prosopis cineraria]
MDAVEEPDTERRSNSIGSHGQRRVGLLYDERMCKHYTPGNDYHPENPDRIRAIWKKLQNAGIPERCVVLDAKEAEDKYLLSVHSKNHVNLIKNISLKQFNSRRNRIASKLNSIYFNEGSSEAAYLAAGSVVEIVEKVARRELNSAVAIVRPPGHHAEYGEAMGFCLFNNVAIASSYLLDERPELGVKKILIVDWDVHHGNGTQKMFWNDSRVLFFSVHRHEFGSFYPANDDGFYTMIGEGPGAGFTVNVPWENGRCGDADYFAVWDHILVPVAKEFNPDMIIVSAGFDAAVGDPLGGCRVTPDGYSVMLEKLLNFAQGRIVLVLEGGYNLKSIANSMLACVKVLLEEKSITRSLEAYPFESTWRVIQAVRQQLSPFWPTLANKLPENLIRQTAPPPHTLISSSDSETEDDKGPQISENLEELLQGVMGPLSKLNVDVDSHEQPATATNSWRSELSNIVIWYASYGSKMLKSRFLSNTAGGQSEGLQMQCSGAMDTTQPREILWKTFPCCLFFGRDSSYKWGPGGVAFLNPERNYQDNTYMCLYKISLEQLNDLLLLENGLSQNIGSPLFDTTALNVISSKEFDSLEVVKGAWYGNVVYLGKEQNIPILTLTCSLSNIESFKSGKLPLRAPNKSYANALVRGLVEGGQLSEAEAIAYIDAAAAKPL